MGKEPVQGELFAEEQTIDDEFLANLNVPEQALIRRKDTTKSLIGKKVSDEGVLDELRNYANISSIPEAREGVQGFLDGLEVEDAGGDSTTTGGAGASVQGGDLAWQERDGHEVEIKIPPSLHHLTKEEWEQVCQILSYLLWQQENSQIH